MNIREKIFHSLLLTAILTLAANNPAHAQLDLTVDTLQCHIIGFNVGPLIPSTQFSFEKAPDGTVSQNATMSSLYKGPYLNFGLDAFYKYKTNWLVSLEGDIWFGTNNLQHRLERMGDIYSRDSIIIGGNGTDANITCYNRGISFQAGLGKIFPLSPAKNPNSGLMARASAGYMRQQTIFMINDVKAPQLTDDYALIYDHQRHGIILTEGFGYWFMSSHSDIINIYLSFEISQCWSWSTREYLIDHYLGVQGKDNNRYFDLLYSIKLCWMFPLRGKVVHDYYFY